MNRGKYWSNDSDEKKFNLFDINFDNKAGLTAKAYCIIPLIFTDYICQSVQSCQVYPLVPQAASHWGKEGIDLQC